MNETEIQILKKSGQITNKAQKFAKKIIVPGVSLFDVGTKIEQFIKEQGAQPAFPVNLSIDNQAAHNSYSDEELLISEDMILKVDIGSQIDGYITDSAQTIIFNKKHELLKEASFNALISAKNYLFENLNSARVCDVGEIIENKISSYGFKPICNLTGHFISKYLTHDSPSIPNVKNNNDLKFIDLCDQKWFAIEPFASTGKGEIFEGANVYIFQYLEDRPIRNPNSRKILEEIKQFNGLPFSEFWVGKEMSAFDRKFALRELLRQQIISSYPVLLEKQNTFVSQCETSFSINDKEIIDLVNIDELY